MNDIKNDIKQKDESLYKIRSHILTSYITPERNEIYILANQALNNEMEEL